VPVAWVAKTLGERARPAIGALQKSAQPHEGNRFTATGFPRRTLACRLRSISDRSIGEISNPDRRRPDHCPQCEAKAPADGPWLLYPLAGRCGLDTSACAAICAGFVSAQFLIARLLEGRTPSRKGNCSPHIAHMRPLDAYLTHPLKATGVGFPRRPDRGPPRAQIHRCYEIGSAPRGKDLKRMYLLCETLPGYRWGKCAGLACQEDGTAHSHRILSAHSISCTRTRGVANVAFLAFKSNSRTPRAWAHALQT